MARSRNISGLVVWIVTLWAMGVAVAQDATWKDCELGASNPDRSIAACSKILNRSSNAAAFHHRALAFEAKGKLDQAISDVSAGIRLDPQSAYRWQKRGELYARQGKYKQAVADLTEAIRKDPTPRAFRFEHRAEAYKGLGDLTHAIADFDEAIRLDPVARAYRFRARANALRDAGQYDRALADYETALRLEPTNTAILVDRGRTYARMGRSDTAKNDFDKALALDPSNAELRHRIEVEVAALPGQIPPSTIAPRPPVQRDVTAAYAKPFAEPPKQYSIVEVANESRACRPAFSDNCITLVKGERVVVMASQIGDKPRRGLYCLRPMNMIECYYADLTAIEINGVPVPTVGMDKPGPAQRAERPSSTVSRWQETPPQSPPPQQEAAAPATATSGTSSTRQTTAAEQPGQGEFARLVKIPAACETARQFGIRNQQYSPHWTPEPGPACAAGESCLRTLRSQAAAAVEYLTRNPAVSDALGRLWIPSLREAPEIRMQRLLAERLADFHNERINCAHNWNKFKSWIPLTENRQISNSTFLQFSTAGKALLEKVRAAYTADESEYQQLLAFNDRYSGLERLERAYASYQQAFKNDDVAAMIDQRPAMLQGLEQARARKQLLTQQSAQLVQYEQTLADLAMVINRDGLTKFASQQSQHDIDELRRALTSLSQTAPSKRGDVSAKLQMFATQIKEVESAIDSARSKKVQAEQTRQKIIENEHAARRVLDAVTSEGLDDDLRSSTNKLISRFRDLENNDLWVISQREYDIQAASNELTTLRQGLEQARGRKRLLAQQSAQLVQNEQIVTGFGTTIDREGLTGFTGQQTQAAIGELRSELARLSQMAPGERGDISARLEDFTSRIRNIDSAIGSARSKKAHAEQTRQMLVESRGAASRVLDAADSEELKGAFDEAFRNSTNELITRFTDLGSADLSVIGQKQEDIDNARRKLTALEYQISDARARYDSAKKLDARRQAVMLKITAALSELARPEIKGKLGNDGLAMVESLRNYQGTLSGFDGIRLINRSDYSATLTAAEGALSKVQQSKDEIAHVAQLGNDLQELNNKVDRRGRKLLDGPTSSMVADVAKSVSTLRSAKIPLSADARLQLSNTRVTLDRLPDVVDNVMDREEKRILGREMPYGQKVPPSESEESQHEKRQQEPNQSRAGQAGQGSARAESSEAKPAPTQAKKPLSNEEILQKSKNRVVVADMFGCRDDKTFQRLRDLLISDKEAYQRLIEREIVSGSCTVFQIGDPVRVDQENSGWGLDPWTCINRPGAIDGCYWTSDRILNCAMFCNDEEKRLHQHALEVQQKRRSP